MTGSWEGRDFGYDQIGVTDPYYDINRTRFSFSPDEIININTPVQQYKHKIPYEQENMDRKCQELLINMRDDENRRSRFNSRLAKLEKERETEIERKREIARGKEIARKKKVESMIPNMIPDGSEFTFIIIFISVVFLVLQLQIQEMNRLLYEISHLSQPARVKT